MRSRRIALLSLVILAGLVVADRLLERAVLGDGLFLGHPVAPFDPPLFSPSQFQALRRLEQELAAGAARVGKFDTELGWSNKPDSGFGEFRYDATGARIGTRPLAREKTPGVRRAVALGCSMTHGEEVRAPEAWCARVDDLVEGLEVANLGVAAYGIDQALLRLRRDGWSLSPDEVWLGVLPQAALRVTTFFRPILDHWSLDVAFKPHFELDAGGRLIHLPNPARSEAEVVRLLHDQRALLESFGGRDPWVARAPLAYAPRGSSRAHASFAARLALTIHEKRGRRVESCFEATSKMGRLYAGIVREMARECVARGALFRVLILPGESDLRQRARDGRGYWEDWVGGLRDEGIRVFDLAEVLGSEADLGRWFARGGHYDAAASERVARALCGELAE